MNTQAPTPRPMKAAGFGFICLMFVLTGLSLAKRFGVIEAAVERRAIGWIIGLIIVGVGFILPRLRPRNAAAANSPNAAAAERFAGWILIPAGIAYIALFIFAPLEQAKPISSLIGISTLAAITICWSWLIRDSLLGGHADDGTAGPNEQPKKKRGPAILLLCAYFYVFAAVCAAFLFDKPWAEGFASWMVVVFWIMYTSASAAVLNLQNRASSELKG